MVMNKKILFIYAVNYKLQNPLIGAAPPSGITWLSRSLKNNGYDVGVCDVSLIDDFSELKGILGNSFEIEKPDFICVSLRNINTSVNPPVSFVPFLRMLSQGIMKLTDKPIIIGGAGFSIYPEVCLRESKIKWGIVGEGEKSLVTFLNKFFSDATDVLEVPGLAYITGAIFHQNPPQPCNEFIDIDYPDHSFVDYDNYIVKGGMIPIQTKRGCSFSCVYCDYPFLEGNTYRLRSCGKIVDEMQALKESGYEYFFFTDSVFNTPQKHTLELLNEIIKRGLNIKWSAYVNPSGFSAELADAFLESGCFRLEMTVDTMAPETLKSYMKNFTTEEIFKADDLIQKKNIPTLYWVNLCGPGETNNTLKLNLKLLGDLKAVSKGWIGVGFATLPNTPLAKLYSETFKDQNNGFEELPAIYVSPQLSIDYGKHIQDFCLDHHKWYSTYDVYQESFRQFSKEIISKRRLDHWEEQEHFGKIRAELRKKGEYNYIDKI